MLFKTILNINIQTRQPKSKKIKKCHGLNVMVQKDININLSLKSRLLNFALKSQWKWEY